MMKAAHDVDDDDDDRILVQATPGQRVVTAASVAAPFSGFFYCFQLANLFLYLRHHPGNIPWS